MDTELVQQQERVEMEALEVVVADTTELNREGLATLQPHLLKEVTAHLPHLDKAIMAARAFK